MILMVFDVAIDKLEINNEEHEVEIKLAKNFNYVSK